jgi:hypothetical protein
VKVRLNQNTLFEISLTDSHIRKRAYMVIM